MRYIMLIIDLLSLCALSAQSSIAHGPAPGEIYISTYYGNCPEVGVQAQEMYLTRYMDVSAPFDTVAVYYSTNDGLDIVWQSLLTDEEWGNTYYGRGQNLLHGPAPGELYLQSWHSPVGLVRIFRSTDYGQSLELQYEHQFENLPFFGSGSSPGVFYILSPEIIYTSYGWYTRLHLYISEDYAQTFPIERIYDLTPDGIVAVSEGVSVAPMHVLLSNHPNPFNPETTLSFSLNEPSYVRLDIYNVRGQRIATLANDHLDSGRHSIVWNAENHPSGVYFARLTSPTSSRTHKLLLLK